VDVQRRHKDRNARVDSFLAASRDRSNTYIAYAAIRTGNYCVRACNRLALWVAKESRESRTNSNNQDSNYAEPCYGKANTQGQSWQRDRHTLGRDANFGGESGCQRNRRGALGEHFSLRAATG
jgi:hypothetical protein